MKTTLIAAYAAAILAGGGAGTAFTLHYAEPGIEDTRLASQDVPAASPDGPGTVDEAMMLQARARMGGSTNIAAKMEAARAKGEQLQETMRAKAQDMATTPSQATIAQLRVKMASNGAGAGPAKAPCDDPPAVPPPDAPGTCTPGSAEH